MAGGKPVGHTAKPLLSVKFYLADNEIMKCRLLQSDSGIVPVQLLVAPDSVL